jgi:hypothetical protein
MLKKGPFVVESFINVGSFHYDYIRKDLGLLMWNMKPCMFCSIWNDVKERYVW